MEACSHSAVKLGLASQFVKSNKVPDWWATRTQLCSLPTADQAPGKGWGP